MGKRALTVLSRLTGCCSLRMEKLRRYIGIIFSMAMIGSWSSILLDHPQTEEEKKKRLPFEIAKTRTFLSRRVRGTRLPGQRLGYRKLFMN